MEHKTVAAVLCTYSNLRNWQLLVITKLITKQIDAGKLDSKFQEIEGSDCGV